LAISKKISIIIAFLIIFTAFSNGQSSDLGAVCSESRQAYGVVGSVGSTFAWAVEDGGIIVQGDGEDTILVQWGYETGQYQIEVIEINASGCAGVPVMAYATIQAPEVDLGFDYFDICDGDSHVFDASGNYFGDVTYLWHDGSMSSSYIADTTENIWVRVTDGLNCVRYDSVEFMAHRNPVVNIGNDTILCDQENPLEIDAGDFVAFDWKTTNENYIGNPIYVYPPTGIVDSIQVVVTDENGCKASDTLLVLSCNLSSMFENMYNTFTPDGDGRNDTWKIIDHMDQFPNAVLEIFDRWGRLVYRTSNVASEPWDGRSKGRDMPMDAYFFVLEINFAGFESISGTVNLIR